MHNWSRRWGILVALCVLLFPSKAISQPLSQVQAELVRIATEIALVEETTADLAMRASTATDFGAILEIELQNFKLERRLLELTDAPLEQKSAFLNAKPGLLDLGDTGTTRASWKSPAK